MIKKARESKREVGTRGRGRARESEKREGVREKRLSLSSIHSCSRECVRAGIQKEIVKVEEERENTLSCMRGRERQRTGRTLLSISRMRQNQLWGEGE